jgi:bacterioferritin (cytochrome b1)
MGKTVLEMVSNIQDAEVAGLHSYNNTIEIAQEVSDEERIELLAKILTMEESHIDWAEIQQLQIEHMGLQNYLANQSEVLAS